MRESFSALIWHRFTMRERNLALITRSPFNNPDNEPPLAGIRPDLLLGERRTIANSVMGIGKVTAALPRRCGTPVAVSWHRA